MNAYHRPEHRFLITTIVLALVLLLGAVPVSARDANGMGTAPAGVDLAADPFVVTHIDYEIEGRTRQWAIEDVLDLREGMRFADVAALETFLADQTQLLVNQRVLQQATIAYTLGEEAENGIPVRVSVQTEDTWNIIVLPYFRYDSNTGLLLSLRGRDYNLFGTMQELAINLDYERTEDDNDLVTVSTEFSLPFRLFEQRWRLILAQSLEVETEDVDFELSLGIGYDFEMIGLDWEATYTQSYRYLSNDESRDFNYLTSRVDLATGYGLPVVLGAFGRLRYRPGLYSETDYRPGGISNERSGVAVGFDHSLGAGRVDWIGNYRRGQEVSLGNDNEYTIGRDEWDRDVTARLSLYRPLWQPEPDVWPKAGVSGSASGFYLIDGASSDQDDAVKDARGILNDRMNGDLAAFVNLDATVTVWTLRPIFEAQLGVFWDTALVRDTRGRFYDSRGFDAERDLRFGSGIEVIGFPLFARSLYVRGSLGFDVRDVMDGKSPLASGVRELFIGLGHHY